jgi:hypothetical protein
MDRVEAVAGKAKIGWVGAEWREREEEIEDGCAGGNLEWRWRIAEITFSDLRFRKIHKQMTFLGRVEWVACARRAPIISRAASRNNLAERWRVFRMSCDCKGRGG